MKYIKLNLSFGEKLKLLFFGLIAENKLPEVIKIVEKEIASTPVSEVHTSINKEETFCVPFFEDNTSVKTNF